MSSTLGHGQYFGSMKRHRHVGGLLLSETCYAPRAFVPSHAHESAYVCFVRKGYYTEFFSGRTRAVGPSTLALHPAGEWHAERFDDTECRSFNIELTRRWTNQFPEHARWLSHPADVRAGPLINLCRRLGQEFRNTDSASELAIQGLFLELLAGFARVAAPDHVPNWLKRVRELVHDTYRENLNLSKLAASVGVQPATLATTFRKHYQCTVGDLQRQLRVEYACRQLAVKNAPLANIAAEAGFADQSHFTRVFTRTIGVSPAKYRRTLINE